MINKLLAESVNFVVEDMSFKGLQRKSKNTERSDKVSDIKQKDGSVKQIHKYKHAWLLKHLQASLEFLISLQ